MNGLAFAIVGACTLVACERRPVNIIGSSEPPTAASPIRSVGEVAGSAYIVHATGDSIVLRDFQVTLLDPAAEQLWKEKVSDEPKNSVRTTPNPFARIHFESELREFEQWVEVKRDLGGPPPLAPKLGSLVIARTRTDVDGKFAFSNVMPGMYIVYAVFRSAASTACWFVPIAVSNGETTHLNLTNSSARAIVNEGP